MQMNAKWKRRGKTSFPAGAQISSIMTDGIGVSLTYSFPVQLRREADSSVHTAKRHKAEVAATLKDKLLAHRLEDELRDSVPTFVGIDLGRAKLFHSSIQIPRSRSELRLPRRPAETVKSKVFTRRQHYWNIGFKKRNRQLQTTLPQQLAYSELSEAGKERNLLHHLRAQQENSQILVKDKIDSTQAAKLKMAAHRLKKSSLRRAADSLIESAVRDKRRLVIGVGSASVQPGGKGQVAAPTVAIKKALDESISAAQRSAKSRGVWRPVEVLTIDEFRTSVSCYRCGSQTKAPAVMKMTKDGMKPAASTRLKECDNCGKRVDRDKQGSRNMLNLTIRKYYGLERPSCMHRKPRA